MTFRNPEYLWLLLLLIPMLVWYIYEQFKTDATLQVSSTGAFNKLPKTKKTWLFHFAFLLRCVAISLLIIFLLNISRFADRLLRTSTPQRRSQKPQAK